MESPTSSRASSPQHSLINSPSLRKHRDRAATSTYRPIQQPSFAPSTTPLKSPGVRYRQQQQQHQRQQQQEDEESELYNALHSTEHDDSLEQPRSAQVYATASPLFKEPSYLSSSKLTESESRLASAKHLQQANDMTKSIYKLLEDNARTKEGVSRQAQNSVSVANQSLEVFRQSQRRSSGTPTSASRTTSAATKVQQQQPVSKPLLRTTETEYDVSPSRTARLLTSPPASSFVGTPSRRSHLRHQTLGSMRTTSPTHRHSQEQQVEEKSRPEDAATLEWLKQTVDAEEFDHQRYTRRASTEVGELPEQQEEHEDLYQTEDRHQETDPFDSATQRDDSYIHKRQSLNSPSRRRRSNEHVEDTYSQKENIPLETEVTSPLDSYLSRSALYPKTPEMDHSVTEAESSLLEVAETTTTITNQLRGVYTNLQDFFSPETEAKLQDAITVIGSQKAIRVAKGLSSSTTRPRPLEFRSASVRKDYRKPSSAPQSTRPLTTPQPFNFSERLNSIQIRRPSPSLSKSLGASAAALRSSRVQDIQRTRTNVPSTPIAQNRTVNEYQEMSKSPFIPLAQRKKQLEKSSLNDLPESTKRSLTIPKAPVLHTSTRPKTTALPFEERVLQDIAQQGGYKANTVDKRVIESSGEYGLPKPVKPRLTVPKSPVLTKRRPAPMRPAVMPIRSDSHHHHSHQHHHQQQKTHRAGIPERGLVTSAESARRLSQDKKSKPAAYHPPPNKPSLTIPEPFSLATDARGQRYQEQFHNKLTKWRQIEKEHQFKALALPTYPEVFVPKKSNKPLTHVVPVHLQTDRRAEEREAFEQERLRKEKLAQDLLAEKAREDELREMRELRALRERLVPHPTPIKEYPRIEIHKSTQPLTTPKSPNIGQKRKRQMTLERDVSHDHEEEVERLHRSRHQRQQRQHQQEHHSHNRSHGHNHRDHDGSHGQYQGQHMEEEQYYVVDPLEEEQLQREQQRENERAQEQEYERRRLSSYSNSRGEGGGGAVDREKQNQIREEIEQQREKDQGYLLEREERQLQAERQAYRRRSSQSRAALGGRGEGYDDRDEYGQDKRQRVGVAVTATTMLGDAKYESQLFARKMGRKSWIAANDI